MATTLQFRRGTTAELAAITGAEAELFVDTDKTTVVVMDGVTSGGIPLATEDYVDTALSGVSVDLTGYATETYVGTAIANLVDTAPTTLDTLNELAAALGDDPNFATTITTALAGKQETLVSATNIKTVNGESLLGSGDITISGGSGGGITTGVAIAMAIVFG